MSEQNTEAQDKTPKESFAQFEIALDDEVTNGEVRVQNSIPSVTLVTQSGSVGIGVKGADDNLEILQEGQQIADISGDGGVTIRTPPHTRTVLHMKLWNKWGGPTGVTMDITAVKPRYQITWKDGHNLPGQWWPTAEWTVVIVNNSGPAQP